MFLIHNLPLLLLTLLLPIVIHLYKRWEHYQFCASRTNNSQLCGNNKAASNLCRCNCCLPVASASNTVAMKIWETNIEIQTTYNEMNLGSQIHGSWDFHSLIVAIYIAYITSSLFSSAQFCSSSNQQPFLCLCLYLCLPLEPMRTFTLNTFRAVYIYSALRWTGCSWDVHKLLLLLLFGKPTAHTNAPPTY